MVEVPTQQLHFNRALHSATEIRSKPVTGAGAGLTNTVLPSGAGAVALSHRDPKTGAPVRPLR